MVGPYLDKDEAAIAYISFPIYQFHKVEPKLICVDTGAPHFRVEDKALERISRHSARRSIPIIDCKREFKFGDTLVRSRDMVELMLPIPGSTLDILVILDVVDVEIPPLFGLIVLEGNNLLVDDLFNNLLEPQNF